MGQTFCVESRRFNGEEPSFARLPLDIGFRILEFLDAPSLCNLALCNSDFFRLANSDFLWRKLSLRKVKGLNPRAASELNMTWKQIHSIIQMFIFIFNTDAERGLSMLLELRLLHSDPYSIAVFLGRTPGLNKKQIGRFISQQSRTRVLEEFVRQSDCRNVLLAEALKNFLARFELGKDQSNSRVPIVETFAGHYVESNPNLGLGKETVIILCFSLILLGTDLTSPHVKNKMSKREFIRNNKGIIQTDPLNDDFLGELYDFVFLEGLFTTKTEPRRCNAVLNQLTLDRHHRWHLLPRVLPLNHALTHQ